MAPVNDWRMAFYLTFDYTLLLSWMSSVISPILASTTIYNCGITIS